MTVAARRQAIFLDRDGTIICDVGYPADPGQVRLLPGVGDALKRLQEQGFFLVLVSNQSGIGRGWVTEGQAERVHQKVVSCLAGYGVQLDAAYYCPHTPEQKCICRKPSPGMLLQAAEDLKVDLAQCFLVGDKQSDISAGKQAGCHTILLAADASTMPADPVPTCTAASWAEIERCIWNCMRARHGS